MNSTKYFNFIKYNKLKILVNNKPRFLTEIE